MHRYKKGDISVPEMLLTEPCEPESNRIEILGPPTLVKSSLTKNFSMSGSSLFKLEPKLDLKNS